MVDQEIIFLSGILSNSSNALSILPTLAYPSNMVFQLTISLSGISSNSLEAPSNSPPLINPPIIEFQVTTSRSSIAKKSFTAPSRPALPHLEGDTGTLHIEESGKGERRVRIVVSVSSDDGVVEVDIGVRDLVEDVDGGGDAAGEGESGDEFGSNVEVMVEMGFEELSVDLLDEVEVGASMKVRELLL
ncbi:hypothetical protein SESBI_28719 [Sesbania bispinosa]|nr:hypothetical protein SESBI_28719 [Sesbania bispinosa]